MGQKSKASESCCVMSIGGQTTQVGVFSAGRLAYESRWSWGGVKFTEIIQNIMSQEEQLAVSWHAAEAIKLELPSLQSDKAHNSKVAIRGKDIINQSSKTKIVNISIFAQAFAEYYAELLENFELFVSELPTELATACLENGIYLTGGGSKIVDLSDHLSKRMHTIVRVHANPELATAQGLVKMSQS
jgi:rod shape-determining protein MreB